ncbi:unnamed protein product [Bursaphelenchus okinawaensis]|uniref:Carbohydrate sulfotransferase n=1 Tax=Bursaphelenchus okinawaensis TaxID=465554 RepID=A0A811L944_9BILA|nr:unnamed protein product [Bursaphelenchus okinawaensis]CAG9118378.1 unnamed protein product [Bursaphelenchus okinawaensis]
MPNYACSQKVAYFESNRTDLIPKTGYNGLAALPPFLSTDTHMIFSTRYKIGACLIPKVMSTIMTAVLCYLQDSEAFIKNNRTIPTETYATRFCHDSIENRHMDEWTRRYNRHGEYTTFTFVREPIDRFLSAFVDKCVVEHREKEERFHLDCYGCSEDVACFIYKMKDRIWKYVEGKHSLSVMDIHVIPQTWHCKMKYYMHDFTIFRYVSTSSDDYKVYLTELTDILMKQNVPQDQIYYVMSGLTGGHSPHSTSNSSVRFCNESIEQWRIDEWTEQHNQQGEYTLFTFVREPINRFLSAFVNKCVVEKILDCYDCGEDVECFIYKLRDRMWKYLEGKHTLSVMDRHVIPQTWHCKMRYYLNEFTIFRYVSTSSTEYKIYLTELTDILMKRNVPQDQISYVMRGLTGGHSPHSTSNSSARSDYKSQLMSRPDLLKILVDLYYYDFVTFGFPFPDQLWL